MASPLHVAQQRTFPAPPDQAFAFTLPVPLEAVFARRFGPLPPVTKTTQDGTWGTAGQTRIVHTADGGTMREELKSVDAPESFTYELTEVTGPMKAIAASIDGSWTFEAVGSGTRITWAWTVHPRSAASAAVFPVLGRLWRGYARRSLDRLEALMLADWPTPAPGQPATA